MKKVNYLNNKDMLLEIHKSKNTFSSFVESEYADYDIILPSLDKINIRTVAEAKKNRAKKLTSEAYEREKTSGNKVKIADVEIDYKKIEKKDATIFIKKLWIVYEFVLITQQSTEEQIVSTTSPN